MNSEHLTRRSNTRSSPALVNVTFAPHALSIKADPAKAVAFRNSRLSPLVSPVNSSNIFTLHVSKICDGKQQGRVALTSPIFRRSNAVDCWVRFAGSKGESLRSLLVVSTNRPARNRSHTALHTYINAGTPTTNPCYAPPF